MNTIVLLPHFGANYTEYKYLFNGENYIYSLTLFVDKKNIFIIESGGIEAYYKKKRESIIKSLSGFSIKE